MEVKRALEGALGDLEKAKAILFEKGLATANKRDGRATNQGVVQAYIHGGGRIGALVELNCETDFVARTNEFKAAAHDLAMQVVAMAPQYVDKESIPENTEQVDDSVILTEQIYIKDNSISIGEMIKQISAKTGEHIKIGRFVRFELGML